MMHYLLEQLSIFPIGINFTHFLHHQPLLPGFPQVSLQHVVLPQRGSDLRERRERERVKRENDQRTSVTCTGFE